MKRRYTLIPLIFTWLFNILLTYSIYEYENYLWNSNRFPTTLKFSIPSTNSHFYFSEKLVLSELRNKKIIPIILSGYPEDDNKKMELIRYESRKLEYTFDTATVIKIHFTEETYYGEFVTIINFLVKDWHKRYTLLGDDLYIFGSPEP